MATGLYHEEITPDDPRLVSMLDWDGTRFYRMPFSNPTLEVWADNIAELAIELIEAGLEYVPESIVIRDGCCSGYATVWSNTYERRKTGSKGSVVTINVGMGAAPRHILLRLLIHEFGHVNWLRHVRNFWSWQDKWVYRLGGATQNRHFDWYVNHGWFSETPAGNLKRNIIYNEGMAV